METVTILRELWRRRLLVGLVALVAILVGLMLNYRPSLPPESRTYEVGVAVARILVDTPRSQVVEVAPRGSDALGVRANLIANVMADGKVKAAIAAQAGLRPRQLKAAAASTIEPLPVTSADAEDPNAYLLTTRVPTNSEGLALPIIDIEAQAPDAARAAILADAAVKGLSDYLDSKAAVEEVSDGRRLRVEALGKAQAGQVSRGPGRKVSLGVAFFLFVSGCAAILLIPALFRSWKRAAVEEQTDLDAASPDLATLDDLFDEAPFERNTVDTSGALDLWAEPPDRTFASPGSSTNGDSSAGHEAGAKST